MTKDVTGPALIGILDGTRAPSREWLKLWIKDNNSLRAAGDAYANKVYEDWGGKAMTAFPYFSDQQLDDVIEYIVAYEVPVDSGNTDLLPCIPETKKEEESNLYMFFIIISISFFIIIIFIILSIVLRIIFVRTFIYYN